MAVFYIFNELEIASSRLLVRRRDSQWQSGHFSPEKLNVEKDISMLNI